MKAVLLALSPSIGMQFYTAGVANALATAGHHDVWVIGSAALRKNAFHSNVNLLSTYSFSSTGLSASALNPVRFCRLLKLMDDIAPSVVHFTGPHTWVWPLALCLGRKHPLILTQHDATTHYGARGEWLKQVHRKAVVEAADCVVLHSRAVEESLRRIGIWPSEASVMPLVHHSFDYSRYEQIRADRSPQYCHENTALLFGRLEEYKGVWQFLDAARLLAALDGTEVKMIVAGTGRLAQALQRYEDLPNVEIRNYRIDDDETIELFSRAGLVVLPYSDGSQSALIPLAYLFQKPVLVTRVGGLPEYVRDGHSGRIIDSNDPEVLAQAIREMFNNREELVRMGQEGHNLLQELEVTFVAKLLDTYKMIAE